jgi:hypothetical protein
VLHRVSGKSLVRWGVSIGVVAGVGLGWTRVQAVVPPKPPPNGPAFSASFNDPKLPQLKTHGTFEAKGGKLTIGNPRNNRENSWVYANPVKNDETKDFTVYTNFSVEMRARLVSDPKMWGGFGIWFRTNGAGQFRNDDWNPDGGAGYVFNYNPGEGGVALYRRSHRMRIGGDPKPVPIDQNPHTYRVDAIGSHLTCYFDGKKVFDTVHPEKPFGYTNGAVGIGIFNRGSVEVESFKITPR